MKAGSPNELSSIDARPALLLLSLKRFYFMFCYGTVWVLTFEGAPSIDVADAVAAGHQSNF